MSQNYRRKTHDFFSESNYEYPEELLLPEKLQQQLKCLAGIILCEIPGLEMDNEKLKSISDFLVEGIGVENIDPNSHKIAKLLIQFYIDQIKDGKLYQEDQGSYESDEIGSKISELANKFQIAYKSQLPEKGNWRVK
jgi:hypothetical protein